MISKYIKGKVSVFIDASNVYYSQKKLKWRIDFRLMKKKYKKRCLVIATKHSISIELIKCAKYVNFNKLKKYIAKV